MSLRLSTCVPKRALLFLVWVNPFMEGDRVNLQIKHQMLVVALPNQNLQHIFQDAELVAGFSRWPRRSTCMGFSWQCHSQPIS